MTLAPGTRLGPYEILSPLGAGGMGEVYRAKDPRLGREIALKILPAELSADAERLRRFEQEARAASALNHPNIVVVYDVGVSDSISYIAMERVEGRSLRELMAPGPLPVRRILPLAAQIAEGLARAHAAGIVHRDLKPENVMVSEEGHVKILDFGLAKLALPAEELTAAPTAAVEVPRTQAGVVLGTVGYMSPEQAAGREIDRRSDLFSFGSILYEMVTGRRAFQRDSAAQTMAAIIDGEPPPISSLRPEAPAPLCWVIERCLAKTPAERYESTRDLARDLANLRDRASAMSVAGRAAVAPAPRRAALQKALPWTLAVLLAAGLAASLLFPRASRQAGREGAIRFPVDAPEGARFVSDEIHTNSAISPDGRTLALVAFSRGLSMIYLRSLDSLAPRALPGTEGAQSPFWSPDGRFLAFFVEGKLQKVDVAGGPPQALCDASFEGTGSWSPEGSILFAEAAPGREGIHSVPAGGGQARRVTVPDAARHELHFWPHFLPDGRHFLYVALNVGGGPAHEVRIGSLDSRQTQPLGAIDSRVEYAPPGFLLYVHRGALLARPFDATTLRWAGEPRPLVEGLHYFYGPANAGFSISQNGVLAFERGTAPSRVFWLDRSGREVSTVASLEQVDHVRLSADGRKAALTVADPRFGTSDIWVYDLARGVSTRLTSGPSNEIHPVWSPDGRQIVFGSDRNGPPDLYEISSEGAGGPKALLELPGVEYPADLSPDGRHVLFTGHDRTTGSDLWLLPLSGERRPVSLRKTSFEEHHPRFSPDGGWIAYDSNESGSSEVYVTAREGGGGRIRISTDGGFSPRWRRDGREIFFLAPGRRVLAAPVKAGAGLEVGHPAELFRLEAVVLDWDVSPDGDRFLVSEPSKPPGPPLTVIANWPALLRDEK